MKRFARALKTLIKIAAAAAAIVVVLAVGALAAFLSAARIDVGSDRLRWLVSKASVSGLEVSWSDARLAIVRTAWLSKEVQLRATDLCVRYQPPAVDACFNKISLGAEAGLRNRLTGVWLDVPTRVDAVVMTGGQVTANLDAFPKSEAKTESKFDVVKFLREKILPRWNANGSQIEVDSLAVNSGSNRWRAAVAVETAGAKTGEPEFMRLTVKQGRDESKAFPVASAEFTVRWPQGAPKPLPPTSPGGQAAPRVAPGDERTIQKQGEAAARQAERSTYSKDGVAASAASSSESAPWTAELAARAKLSASRKIRAEAHATARAWDDVDYAVDAAFAGFAPLEKASVRGGYRAGSTTGVISARAGAFGASVTAASAVDCAYAADLGKKQAGLKCGPEAVRISLKESIAPPSLRSRRSLFELRPTFEFKALNVEFGKRLAAEVSAAVALKQKNLINLEARAQAKLEGPSASDLRWSADGDASARIPDFASIVKFLRGTPFAVPAPINGLAGPIGAKVDVHADQTGGGAPFSLRTQLASQDQAIDVAISGRADFAHVAGAGWTTNAVIKTKLNDVRLSAPRLALKAPPQIAPDGRFKSFASADRSPAAAKKPSAVTFQLDVETATPGAVQIATNLTGAPIPISVDVATRTPAPAPPAGAIQQASNPGVAAESGATTSLASAQTIARAPASAEAIPPAPAGASVRGSVLVGRTPVKFLRRDAHIEQMRVDFLPNGRRRLDGRLSVDYPDYDISVFVAGFSDSPQLRFESDPPLNQDQIIAALLFGKPINELSPDERSSTANMNAAVADAALSFSSLYLFADTPIEGIGYDPERGLVTARVGLGGGNSLEVGSGAGGSAEVGVRRKLSRNLVFNTYVERVGETDQKVVAAFIEWVKKF